jgi:hypothetical protein
VRPEIRQRPGRRPEVLLRVVLGTVSRENRSVADLLLRTSVVYDWQTAPPRVDGFSGAAGP